MATLREFEDALRQHGMVNALAILDQLKKRDRERRSIAPARRVVGRKMTVELARSILDMHASTGMTQQEIAFKLGVNQGRVNEVIKRGKWLNGDPAAPEAKSRDKAMDRLNQRAKARRAAPAAVAPAPLTPRPARGPAVAASPARPAAEPRQIAELSPGPAELPLHPPKAETRRQPATAAARAPLRRQAEEPAPIVSAQLAFLDL